MTQSLKDKKGQQRGDHLPVQLPYEEQQDKTPDTLQVQDAGGSLLFDLKIALQRA